MKAGDARRALGRARLLAPARDDARLWLPAIAGAMAFLAALALAAAFAAGAFAQRWQAGLEGRATVELPADSGDEAIAATLAALAAAPGVARAELLDRAHVAALVEPFLGTAASTDALPLPVLIDVALAPGAEAGAIARALAIAAPAARLDDHAAWRAQVSGLARLVRDSAAGAVALVLAVAAAAVGFATRARLAVRRDEIEILHLMGARDAAIAREFALDALVAAALGGAVGAALAGALTAALGAAAIGLTAGVAALAWPAALAAAGAVALVAGATAWIAARAALARLA